MLSYVASIFRGIGFERVIFAISKYHWKIYDALIIAVGNIRAPRLHIMDDLELIPAIWRFCQFKAHKLRLSWCGPVCASNSPARVTSYPRAL
jgi:hypothetical protein